MIAGLTATVQIPEVSDRLQIFEKVSKDLPTKHARANTNLNTTYVHDSSLFLNRTVDGRPTGFDRSYGAQSGIGSSRPSQHHWLDYQFQVCESHRNPAFVQAQHFSALGTRNLRF